MKTLMIFISISTLIFSNDSLKMINAHSIDVKHVTKNGEHASGTISRESFLKCRNIPFEPHEYWGGNHSLDKIDNDCKKTFITSAGKLSPMKIHEKIETYGELEVLEFIEDMQNDPNLLIIDSRKSKWFNELTIPTAINIPFTYFTEKNKWESEREKALALFGVKKTIKGYDFKDAKSLLMFCNAVWCRQSPQMIESLIDIGYPPEKMFWYRGGMQSWTNVGMTTTRSFKKQNFFSLF